MWFNVYGPVKIKSGQWNKEGYWPVGQCQKILMSQPEYSAIYAKVPGLPDPRMREVWD